MSRIFNCTVHANCHTVFDIDQLFEMFVVDKVCLSIVSSVEMLQMKITSEKYKHCSWNYNKS